jgi:transposase
MLLHTEKTLTADVPGLLAFCDHTIGTGPLEEMNNKIKSMSRQAHGFCDLGFQKLKILTIRKIVYVFLLLTNLI